jgi:hypothetical protein
VSETSQDQPKKKAPKLRFQDLLLTFLIPIIVGKIMTLYFGTNYAAFPGEGYGYGLVFSICFTLFGFARFLWKYRHHEEDETRP